MPRRKNRKQKRFRGGVARDVRKIAQRRLGQRNIKRTYLEAIKRNPRQFGRDVLRSAPRNRQELVRNLADYNENVLMLLSGNFKRHYPPKRKTFPNIAREHYRFKRYAEGFRRR